MPANDKSAPRLQMLDPAAGQVRPPDEIDAPPMMPWQDGGLEQAARGLARTPGLLKLNT